jgi:N-acetylmuramoyl-L-alanine amidase
MYCLLIIIFFISKSLDASVMTEKQYTIMLDPAGDAQRIGRVIGDSFERAVTLNIAKSLQNILHKSIPCTVIITRSPGEIIYPLQNANFANRLLIDLYLSIHCYYAPHEKHTIAIYTLSRGDPFITSLPELSFIPFTKAHWQSSVQSTQCAHIMHTELQAHYAHQFELPSIAAIPLISLVGIQAPALSIELNIISSHADVYIEPLAKSIVQVLTSCS